MALFTLDHSARLQPRYVSFASQREMQAQKLINFYLKKGAKTSTKTRPTDTQHCNE